MPARWEHFSHEADMGLHGIGASRTEAFEQVALAMTGAITDPASVATEEEVAVTCSAPDDEVLLMDWLNSLVYEMATRKMLFGKFRVRIHDRQLQGTAWGEPVDIERHHPAVEVKGATMTELSVRQDANGAWHARCVVDV